jgi:hypothetical protein
MVLLGTPEFSKENKWVLIENSFEVKMISLRFIEELITIP